MFQNLLKSVPKKKSKIYPLEVRGVKGSIISFIKTRFWSIRFKGFMVHTEVLKIFQKVTKAEKACLFCWSFTSSRLVYGDETALEVLQLMHPWP
jgi:hypothetical protein